MKDHGKRHTLLLFRTRYRRYRAWYLFASLIFIGVYVLVNQLPLDVAERFPWTAQYDWILLLIGSILFLLFLGRTIAGEIPYVQCTERNLKIQTPFLPLYFSYRRVKETRPNALFEIFRRDKVSRREARFLEKVAGQTAIIVDMNGYPMSMTWMKFWMSNLMFTPDGLGLVLWVQDWMMLNRELSDFKDHWRDRKLKRDEPPPISPYSRLRQ